MGMPAKRHQFVPFAILVFGWAIGLAIYLSAAGDEQLPFELTDASKLYRYRLEEAGGKSALLYEDIRQFVESLWHAPRLGLTIGVLASVVALVWFRLAPRR
jgi:hypothetical protein